MSNFKELPVGPKTVLKHFEKKLSSFEFREVLEYQEIFYISDMEHKIAAKSESDYDDEKYFFTEMALMN